LENICYDFQLQHPLKYIIKLTKTLRGDKSIASRAWKIVNDSYKTLACLMYPAHTIAAAAVYLAARLLKKDDFPQAVVNGSTWHTVCFSRIEDIEEICHLVLDMYMQGTNDPLNHEYATIKIALNRMKAERIENLVVERESSVSTIGKDSPRPYMNGVDTKDMTVRYLFSSNSP